MRVELPSPRAVARERAAVRVREEGLPLRLADVVLTSVATLLVAYLVLAGRWVPGWWQAALVYALIAVGAPLLRALALRFPRVRLFDLLASVWILPSAGLGHFHFGTVVDAVRPGLKDQALYLADLRLFGTTPAMVLDRYIQGAALDAVMICYYGYFFWMTALALVLYFRAERAAFDQYMLALTLCFAVNFTFYVLVPAIGPRFFLANDFAGPLPGGWITAYLDSMMRNPTFVRDCFPSGHTAGTLIVLTYAYRYQRRFFWVALGPGVGLILATLVGRFHYGIDLVCAVPLVVAAVSLAGALCRARPAGVVVPAPAFAQRASVEA
jgi:hypothetical protein